MMNNELLQRIAIVTTPVLLTLVSALLVFVIQNNTYEHEQIRKSLDGKVSNEVLIQYMKLQEIRWELQGDKNEELDEKIGELERKYIARGVRGNVYASIRFLKLGSFVWDHDENLVSMFNVNCLYNNI